MELILHCLNLGIECLCSYHSLLTLFASLTPEGTQQFWGTGSGSLKHGSERQSQLWSWPR